MFAEAEMWQDELWGCIRDFSQVQSTFELLLCKKINNNKTPNCLTDAFDDSEKPLTITDLSCYHFRLLNLHAW